MPRMRAFSIEVSSHRIDNTGCLALWRAVLHRALNDACYNRFDKEISEKEARKLGGEKTVSRQTWIQAQHARSFLLTNNSRFDIICVLAEIEPGFLRRHAKKLIETVDSKVKFSPPPITCAKAIA